MKLTFAILCTFVLCASARAVTINFCNQGKAEVLIFAAHFETHLISESGWVVEGWYPVSGGNCTKIYAADDHGRGSAGLLLGFKALYAGNTFYARPSTSGSTKSNLFSSSASDFFSVYEDAVCTPDKGTFEYMLPDKPATVCGKGWNLGTFGLKFFERGGWDDLYNVRFPFNLDSVLVPEGNVEKNVSPPSRPAGTTSIYEQFVKEDITEYIAAAQSDFDQFKLGEPQIVDGHKGWQARKPKIVDSCQIIAMTTNIFVCQFGHYKTARDAEDAYNRLTIDVAAAVPTWTRLATPYKSELYSMQFLSPSQDLEGEIWVHAEPDQSMWTLHYQILKRALQGK